jgi:hypothetical protein
MIYLRFSIFSHFKKIIAKVKIKNYQIKTIHYKNQKLKNNRQKNIKFFLQPTGDFYKFFGGWGLLTKFTLFFYRHFTATCLNLELIGSLIIDVSC